MVAPYEVAPPHISPAEVLPDMLVPDAPVLEIDIEKPNRHVEAVFLSAGAEAVRETVDLTKKVTDPAIPRQRDGDPARAPKEKIEIVDGRLMRVVSYFDGDSRYASLTAKTAKARIKQYQDMGLYTHDMTEDPIRGDNIEFVTVVDPETREPAAGLRKIHATEDTLDTLPSYERCQGNFSPEGRELLATSAAGRAVVEVAALWKDPAYGTDTKVVAYIEAIQRSVERNELWLVGVVAPEYRGLMQTYGPNVVRSLGAPTSIDEEAISKKVRLYPAIIDPAKFYDGLITEIQDAKAAGDHATAGIREVMLWSFLDGLDWHHLSEATVRNIERISHGRIAR